MLEHVGYLKAKNNNIFFKKKQVQQFLLSLEQKKNIFTELFLKKMIVLFSRQNYRRKILRRQR